MVRIIKEVVALLNRLIQLDHDAIATYRAAINHVTKDEDRSQLGWILGNHRRHADELTFVVRNLGGDPASHGDLRQAWRRGRVSLGALSGEHDVLEALRGSEADAVAAYADAASQPGIPMDVRSVLERQLADERRHHAWLSERLEAAPPVAARDTYRDG
jgi:uncharacterized protein (TIGR02284 family)